MEPRVGPADCALAVALPLTWAEFVADSNAPDHDFVRSMVEGSGRTVRHAWDEVYAPRVVRTCERVADRVSSLGGRVVFGVTAKSLATLLAAYPVVCLVAHSSFARLAPDDLIDPDAVLDMIVTGESVVARYLRTKLEQQIELPADDLRTALAAFLNSSLEPTRSWFGSVVRREHRAAEPVLHRVMLEDYFGKAMRRAPLLELRDGMQTMDDLLAAIPDEFGGVLDLSVCNSVALGESIKRCRRDCLVIENSFLARIDLRLARYALAMRLLAERTTRYTDAMLALHLELIKG